MHAETQGTQKETGYLRRVEGVSQIIQRFLGISYLRRNIAGLTMASTVPIFFVLSVALAEGHQENFLEVRSRPNILVGSAQYTGKSADHPVIFSNQRSLLRSDGEVEQSPKRGQFFKIFQRKSRFGGKSRRRRRKILSGESTFSDKLPDTRGKVEKTKVENNDSPKNSGVMFISGGSHIVKGHSGSTGKTKSRKIVSGESNVSGLNLQKLMGLEKPRGETSNDSRGNSNKIKTKTKTINEQDHFSGLVESVQKNTGWGTPGVVSDYSRGSIGTSKNEAFSDWMKTNNGGAVYIPHLRRKSKIRNDHNIYNEFMKHTSTSGGSQFVDTVPVLPKKIVDGESQFGQGSTVFGHQIIKGISGQSDSLGETVSSGQYVPDQGMQISGGIPQTANEHITVEHCKTTAIDINPLLNYIDRKFEGLQRTFSSPLDHVEGLFNKFAGIMGDRIAQLADDLFRRISLDVDAKLTSIKVGRNPKPCQRSFQQISKIFDVVTNKPSNGKLEKGERFVNQRPFERCNNVQNGCTREVMSTILDALSILNRKLDHSHSNDSLLFRAIRDLQPHIMGHRDNMMDLRNVLNEYQNALMGSISKQNVQLLSATKSVVDEASRRFHMKLMGAFSNMKCPVEPLCCPKNPPIGSKVFRITKPPVNGRYSSEKEGRTAPWWLPNGSSRV